MVNEKRLNLVYFILLAFIALVVVGFLPRSLLLYFGFVLVLYFMFTPLEESVLFFVRSIPFFFALPLTSDFDSLNIWRILSIIIFLRWLKYISFRTLFNHLRRNKILLSVLILFVIALFSITQAESATLAIRRVIFFVNLGSIGLVVADMLGRKLIAKQLLFKNIVWPTVIVTAIGMIQLISTYFLDIFQFIDFWAGTVEKNMYGKVWAETALQANTWFAYFGDQISLRMFSIFPDSHSFPIFILFGLPAVFAFSLDVVITKAKTLKEMLKIRGRLLVVWVPLIFLAVILSGTRGMWLAGFVTLFLFGGFLLFTRKNQIDFFKKTVLKYILSYFSVFFLLFAVAYPIFASSQFEISESAGGLLARRIRSVIDLTETSNARRIEIWKDSVISISRHPLLGVGIGNFPVVVGENLAKAKAGSSAHNLYLHIAAELGIPALLVVLYFLAILLKRCLLNFKSATNSNQIIYFGSLLIFIPWNLFYSFTDVAIFDERAFLLFVITTATVLSQKNEHSISHN